MLGKAGAVSTMAARRKCARSLDGKAEDFFEGFHVSCFEAAAPKHLAGFVNSLLLRIPWIRSS